MHTIYKSAFPTFSLKVSKDEEFLIFSGIKFHICGTLYVKVSVRNLTVFLLPEYRDWKFLRLRGSSPKNEKGIEKWLLKRIDCYKIYLFLWLDVQEYFDVWRFHLTFLRYNKKLLQLSRTERSARLWIWFSQLKV